jgi:hypothetical protein
LASVFGEVGGGREGGPKEGEKRSPNLMRGENNFKKKNPEIMPFIYLFKAIIVN